jgi:transcriptional regulator with XRE-family HTH domain
MEKKLKSFKELAEAARKSPVYFVQGAILDFTEDVVARMQSLNISKKDLAKKLHTSSAYVSKLLGGANNFTLETMVNVALAVDAELRVHLQPKGSICQWIDVLEGQAHDRIGSQVIESRTVSILDYRSKQAANEELTIAA